MGSLTLDTFLTWFEGDWDNQQQAYNNPRGQSYVKVSHRRLAHNEFNCTYRMHRQKHPYRSLDVTIMDLDGTIILKNPVHDIHFNLEHGSFVSRTEFIKENIRYVNEAILGAHFYHVVDQGFDLATGKQLWGLEGDSFYEFHRSGRIKN